MAIAANTSLANLAAVSRRGLIDDARGAAPGAPYVERLRIKTPSLYAETGSLSGGNQQKVALARWLAIEPEVLILDEPTQGVDVGSKSEIHQMMVDLAGAGHGDYHDIFGAAGDSGHERSHRGDARGHASPAFCRAPKRRRSAFSRWRWGTP